MYVPCAAHSLNLTGSSEADCCPEAVKKIEYLQNLYVVLLYVVLLYGFLLHRRNFFLTKPENVNEDWNQMVAALQFINQMVAALQFIKSDSAPPPKRCRGIKLCFSRHIQGAAGGGEARVLLHAPVNATRED